MWSRTRRLTGALFLASFFSVLSTLPAEAALWRQEGQNGALPEGDGRELVESLCTQCHSLNMVTAQKKNKREWEQVINRMVSSGMEVTPEDADMIAGYLADHFGPESKPAPGGSGEPGGGAGREGGGGPSTELPDGPGKDVVADKCSQCHSSSMWRDLRQDREKWEGTLYRMVARGAVWTEEEIAAMAQYLATVFGPKPGEATDTRQE